MSVFNSGVEIYHTEGSRNVWSTTRRPVLLLHANRTVLNDLDFAWPDLAKANAYAYAHWNQGGFTSFAAASFITAVPQSWDSGLTAVATIPAGCNYFQLEVNLARITTPSLWLQQTIPMLLRPDRWQTLDGASAVAERFGPLVRIFRFERVGNTIYLRRKQSVVNAGARFPWNPDNSPTFPGSGGQRPGWTWGGTNGNLGHAASMRASTSAANCNRGQSNQVTVADNTNYASTWRGTVIITPGYIKE